MLLPLDVELLTHQFHSCAPFPHIVVDPLVEPEFARRVAGSYPTFGEAERLGMRFKTVNERNKVQVTDEALFPEPVRQLAAALAAPEFMRQLEQITGIPKLLWDPKYHGGGMHQTSQSGILDVHVDFNFIDDRFRRLNILVYLNEEWDEAWGGHARAVGRTGEGVPPLRRPEAGPGRDLRDVRAELSRGDRCHLPSGEGSKVLCGVLLHGRTARRLRRNGALHDLQGQAGRVRKEVRADAGRGRAAKAS
jgi:hypothetical protein